MKTLHLLDSTLRDGVQGENISFSSADKLKVYETLASLGLHYIEAGNPSSNMKDALFFDQIASLPHKDKCVAFGSTRRKDTPASEDTGLLSLLSADTKNICVFGKTSLTHVREILHTTKEENLRMIEESIAFLKENNKFVIFDAEHFFDGYAEDADYAFSALEAAASGGADVLCLCDTNGATYSEDIYEITKKVVDAFPAQEIGIHCHNDIGLAVASSMRAVDAGATHVQGTLLGFGERAGNANLSTLIANLQLKGGYACIPPEKMPLLTGVCRKLADIANYTLPGSMPYVGDSAFAHKGGMHVDAVQKLSASFEHITPEDVGNTRRILLSEVAGRATILDMIHAIDPSLSRDAPEIGLLIEKLKELEYKGYQFEAAPQSFELVIRRALGKDKKYFELDHYKTIGEQPLFGKLYPSSALVKVRVGGISALTAAEGNGPVNALDLALRKALSRFYPTLEEVWLTDFKVRVIDSSTTTAASVRVLLESSDGIHTWSTVGVSTDILEASFLALSDAIEYKLYLDHVEVPNYEK